MKLRPNFNRLRLLSKQSLILEAKFIDCVYDIYTKSLGIMIT